MPAPLLLVDPRRLTDTVEAVLDLAARVLAMALPGLARMLAGDEPRARPDEIQTHDTRILRVRPHHTLGRYPHRWAVAAIVLLPLLFPLCSSALPALSTLWTVGSMLFIVVIGALEDRRGKLALHLHLRRSSLELVWRRHDRCVSRRRVPLREIGPFVLRRVGYQRWHLVGSLADGKVLRIPMERESLEAVWWVADQIGRASQEARAREGTVDDVPPDLDIGVAVANPNRWPW